MTGKGTKVMKTVVISGYYGYENIGDEALLAAIIGALRAEIFDLHIIVLSATPKKTGTRYGVEGVNRLSLFSVFSALKRADLLISGGGSLLQDVTGPLTIPYYLGIVALARMLGKPVMFYAQGIGPVNGVFGRALIRLVADGVDMITLRDRASIDLLREIGVHNPPVELTADPVFGMDVDRSANAREFWALPGTDRSGKPVMAIFVREWRGLSGYKKAVAQLADYMYDKGWEAAFVPMQYPGDVAPAREIAGLMNHNPIIIERGLSFTELTGLVSSTDLVIGMRLHALIIATICEIPMVGISYDPKVAEFLDSIDQPVVKELESITSGSLIEKVNDIAANKEAVKRQLLETKTALRHKALRNSKVAVQLLNR